MARTRTKNTTQGMNEYKELKLALEYFRELFVRKLLPNSAVNNCAGFLKEIRQKKTWTKADALKVYNIIKPYSLKLRSLNFYFDNVPIISTPSHINKKVYRLPKEKLIGYDKNAFVVYFPYSQNLYKEIMKVPGAIYNKEKRYVNVPLAQNKELKKFGEKWGFKMTEKGRAMLNNITENFEASYKAEKVDLNLPLKLEPYPFQSAGIDYAIKNKCVIIADEMGLGKTPQAMSVPLALDEFPCLVICPKSLRLNWQSEIHKFTHKKAMLVNKSNAHHLQRYYEMGLAQYFIINYEGARTIFTEEIKEVEITTGQNAGTKYKKVKMFDFALIFKSVILDEAHECRNEKTIRHKTIKPIMLAANIKLCLTGSPIVKGTKDMASLLELIGRIKDFGGRYKFIRAYNKMTRESFGSKTLPDNLKELNIKLRSLCFIRREKFQVLKELPDKMRQIIKVDIDNQNEYDLALNMFMSWMVEKGYSPEKIDRAMKAEMLVRINILKQLTAKGKLSALKEFLEEVLDSGEKVVVFCWFLETARYIGKNFENVLFITGDQSDEEIEQNKKLFQDEKSKYKIIVVTYKKGGTGHTLTASSKVAFIELGWTWKDQGQAEDRCHRIGTKNAVNCYYFLGNNTIDEGIYQVIEQRREMEKDATGGTTEIQTTVSNFIANQIYEKSKKQSKNSPINENKL